jgi:hypothetical protein
MLKLEPQNCWNADFSSLADVLYECSYFVLWMQHISTFPTVSKTFYASSFAIWLDKCRTGISALLVRNTRSRPPSNDRTSAKRWMMAWLSAMLAICDKPCSPAYRQHICGAIGGYNGIASRSLRKQWHQLILRPLSKLDGTGCQALYILIAEALSECGNEDDISTTAQEEADHDGSTLRLCFCDSASDGRISRAAKAT